MNYTDFISAKLIFSIAILVVLFAYWIFNFIILYHLARFGVGTQPKKFAMVFFLGSVCLFFISALLFATLDLNYMKEQLTILANSFFNITYSPQI